MSFSPGAKKIAMSDAEVQATVSDLPFLQPIKPGGRSGAASLDPAKAEKVSDEARKKTLRTLNAIKIISPVLSAVVERHGASGSEDESLSTFRRLVSQASEMSELMIRELGEDPEAPGSFWLRNMLERTFCEILRDQVQRGKEGSLKSLQPVLREVAKMQWASAEGAAEFETWGTDTTVRAALMKATAPVMIKAAVFDFFRADLAADMEDVMRVLMGAASRATLSIVDSAASEREKASLFAVLVGEAGLLYASAWNVCGKQVVGNLSGLNDKELKELLAQSPSGLPLDKVNAMFEKSFSRLVALSVKLVPQKPGKIESRLKKTVEKT